MVAPEAAQADIDVMGADLGLGSRVVAFQLKASETDPRIRYEIYSLSKPPQLLRTITGDDYFSAADTLLDGSVEIWTTDAAAIRGFEGLPLDALDPAPTVILRFEKKKLIDVSSEFRPYFDRVIKTLHSQLDARQLNDFRQSDGKLSNEHWIENHQPQGLLATKVKVLEMVWCYLYSGREPEAWKTLAEMWPSSDLNRIHNAIVEAQAHGLRAQVDGIRTMCCRFGRRNARRSMRGWAPIPASARRASMNTMCTRSTQIPLRCRSCSGFHLREMPDTGLKRNRWSWWSTKPAR